MDYPKSVPSVGLVGGKFVDESPLIGTPGSLIPAQWGNAVSDEILNVITAAGIVPDELLNTQLATAISLIIGTTRPLATQAEAEAGTDNAKTMTAQRTQQAISKRAAIVGSIRNLRISVAAASAAATVTADEIFVKAALGGAAWLVTSFNKNINLTTPGAGGMDTGAAPVSGFVAVYAIYNPTTGASALLATNATGSVQPEIYGGANMPAGYLASALVTVWPTNASGQFVVAYQEDRQISFIFAVAATTVVGIGSPTAINVATLIPRNAKSCSGWALVATNGSSYANVNISASSNTIGLQQIAGPSNGGAGTSSGSFSRVPIITMQTIYWSTTATGGTFTSASVYISGYAI